MKNCVQIQGYTRMLIYRQLPSIVTITTFKIERVIKGITEQHPQLKLFIRKETKICYPQEHQNPPNYGVDNTPTIHDQNITWQHTQLKLFIRKETKTCYTQEHQNPPNYGVDNTPTIHDQNITWQHTQLKWFIRKETQKHARRKSTKIHPITGYYSRGPIHLQGYLTSASCTKCKSPNDKTKHKRDIRLIMYSGIKVIP